MVGKVRLLPPGSPVPPRGEDPMLWCDETIPVEEVPGMVHEQFTISYLCTRDPHPPDEVHVSDPGDPARSRSLDPRIIVWGGE